MNFLHQAASRDELIESHHAAKGTDCMQTGVGHEGDQRHRWSRNG